MVGLKIYFQGFGRDMTPFLLSLFSTLSIFYYPKKIVLPHSFWLRIFNYIVASVVVGTFRRGFGAVQLHR
jgi:hypothetical protein